MNTPVSFELAKMLKGRGFDDSTETLYWLEDKLNPEVVYSRTPRQGFFKEYGGSLLAPTIAEVVMWLYEKHGVWIYTRPFSSGYFHGYIVDNSGEMKEAINTINFNSPAEAYEAAIEYTLKTLIP